MKTIATFIAVTLLGCATGMPVPAPAVYQSPPAPPPSPPPYPSMEDQAAAEQAAVAAREAEYQAGMAAAEEEYRANQAIHEAQRKEAARKTEEYFESVKRERDEKEAAEAAHIAELEQRREDPAFFVPALSSNICAAREVVKLSKAAIAEEKSVARRSGGGVVDMSRIYEFQGYIKQSERNERYARRYLQERGKKAQACGQALVAQLAPCAPFAVNFIEINRPEAECGAAELAPYIDLADYLTAHETP